MSSATDLVVMLVFQDFSDPLTLTHQVDLVEAIRLFDIWLQAKMFTEVVLSSNIND